MYTKEVNKWVSERGLGLLDPRAQRSSGPELKAQTPQQEGQAQQVREEEEVFVDLLSPGRLVLAQRPLQQQPPPED